VWITDIPIRDGAGWLPSREKLAEEYCYTHMTVARALSILKDEGLIYGVPGLGVFVR
jgi:DNA-binding GntR family transcriptional regulator